MTGPEIDRGVGQPISDDDSGSARRSGRRGKAQPDPDSTNTDTGQDDEGATS